MLTKSDCLSILVELENKGISINNQMKKLIISKEIPIDVLKFILDNKGIEVSDFYEMLRKNHNKKKSPLYLNLVRDQETDDDILVTLACLMTQITLYSKKLEKKDKFLSEVRANEVAKVLNDYFNTYDITSCKNLLKLVKADILCLEYIAGRRELK